MASFEKMIFGAIKQIYPNRVAYLREIPLPATMHLFISLFALPYIRMAYPLSFQWWIISCRTDFRLCSSIVCKVKGQRLFFPPVRLTLFENLLCFMPLIEKAFFWHSIASVFFTPITFNVAEILFVNDSLI